ncbi:MAG TPA: sugar phosphate isomerase/epimerase family protein [Gemmataceae bacterium]|nr:sugar phosphate isomerase/epimerase family protein [Gemmataceae bacterium]
MRYAICNETFEGWDHERVCRFVASLGYTGLEIAPFTLAPRITDVSAERRKLLRKQAEDAGLTILGLHWLLAKTEEFQLTSPDAAVRQRTAKYLGELARCCRDLGGDILVFGSPKQREIPPGHSYEHAREFAVDTFHRCAEALAEHNVTLCLEPLAPSDTPFINTCAEATEILQRIDHPNFALHQDVKAMSAEAKTTVPELIRRYASWTRHFHANDPNLRGPGFGATDFHPIFQALKDVEYSGWVSVEVFDYSPDPETIARKSIEYMRRCEPLAA